MKNIVRAFVLTLALTGMFASTRVNTSSATTVAASVSTAKTSAMPVPRCDPNTTTNGCGIDNW